MAPLSLPRAFRRPSGQWFTVAGLLTALGVVPIPGAVAFGATLGALVGANFRGTAHAVHRPRAAGDTVGDFMWKGHVDAARWIRVRNLSGGIRVEPATGNEVVITGRKNWRHGDPNRVRITLQRTGPGDGDVLVCALWDDRSTCDESGYSSHSHHRWSGDDDVAVDFTVQLPAGLNVLAETVNGDVDVAGATAQVDASSVNGGVEAATQGGPVRASSVNGDVRARMQSLADLSHLEYSSVNGSVTVTLPADLKADVDLETVNGSVRSAFPISVSGTMEPKHLHGTISGGGAHLHVETVNGSVELLKG